MEKALLDTDILSEVIKDRNESVRRRMDAYLTVYANITISSLTVLEIARGFRKARRLDRIAEFNDYLDELEVLVLDRPGALIAAEIWAALEAAGETIGRIDPLIAAVAVQHGLVLTTGNLQHYQRVSALGFDLHLQNWRD